jgi:hypothetical protein
MGDQQNQVPAQKEPREGLQKVGMYIFVIVNAFCATEMVPGWGLFHLKWPTSTFYLISVVGGGLGGALLGGRYVLPGLVGGLAAGPGALLAVGLYLGAVTVSHSFVSALCMIVGALPGFGIGLILKRMQEGATPSQPPAAHRIGAGSPDLEAHREGSERDLQK